MRTAAAHVLRLELARVRELNQALNDINRAIATTTDVAEIMCLLLTESAHVLGADTGGVALRDGADWVLSHVFGFPPETVGNRLHESAAPVMVMTAARRAPVAIGNAREEPGLNQELMRRYGIWAILSLPLILDGGVFGVLSFDYHSGPMVFDEDHLGFARNLAASATLALENARRRQAERALAADIGRRKQVEDELRAARDALAAEAGRLEQRVQERTGELLQREAALAQAAEQLRQTVEALRTSEERFRVALLRAPVLVFNQDCDLRYTWIYNPHPAFRAEEVIGHTDAENLPPDDAAALAAIKRQVLTTGQGARAEVRTTINGEAFFYDLVVEPLCDEAGQVQGITAAAMDITDRKRTEQRLQQQSERLRILHEIDAAILAATAPAEIAQAAVDFIRRVVPCTRAGVLLFDVEEQQARLLAANSIGASAAAGRDYAVPLASWSLASELLAGRPAMVPDLTAAPFAGPLPEEILIEGARSYFSTPLLVGGEAIGALNIWRATSGAPSPEHQEVARQVADSLAVALENARLDEQVRASQAALVKLTQRLVTVQEDERVRIAAQLYDDEGQRLSALLIGLGLLEREAAPTSALSERIAGLKQLADGLLTDLHALAMRLRPASLDRLGLVPALRQYVDQFGREHGIATHLQVTEGRELDLSPEAETVLYRILQEALNNVARHARATHAGVLLGRQGHSASLIIEDDGIGFDVAGAGRSGCLGILAMQQRAVMVSGSLTVESRPGAGTTIFVRVPCRSAGSIS